MSDRPRATIGTAGHIDHGKSSLVQALSGTNPDRLPEEQARGMTIDLGFAHLDFGDCEVYLVDVPGHERFIRNMLAGATGIDAALLVVAADDSVMPQTREHAELLALLGVTHVTPVITKIDLVDAAWADEVQADVDRLLRSVGIEPRPGVRTSAVSGAGIDALRGALASLARESPRAAGPAWFRLPVDRAFSVAGRGTVVTGTVQHGSIAQHDELELWPAGERVRVRDLQTHNDAVEAAHGRLRLAVNLAGVPLERVTRGCTLATPGYLEPSRCMDVWLERLRPASAAAKVMPRECELRLHLGTGETLVRVRLASEAEGPVVSGAPAQIRTAEPLVAEHGQRFVLRDVPGSRTLGGGRVLRPVAAAWTGRRPAFIDGLRALADGPPLARLEEVVRAAEWNELDGRRLATRAGLRDEAEAHELCKRLQGAGRVRTFEASGQRLVLHNALLDGFGAELRARLKAYLGENSRLAGLPRTQLPAWLPSALVERYRPLLAEHLLRQGAIVLRGEHVTPADERPRLSADDQALLDAIMTEFHTAAYQPPEPAALRCRTAKNEKRVRELIDYATANNQLVRVSEGLWLDARHWATLVKSVCDAILARGPMTVSDIRSLLGTTRKFMVPIAEKLDALGVTRRNGDLRSLGPQAPPAGQ